MHTSANHPHASGIETLQRNLGSICFNHIPTIYMILVENIHHWRNILMVSIRTIERRLACYCTIMHASGARMLCYFLNTSQQYGIRFCNSVETIIREFGWKHPLRLQGVRYPYLLLGRLFITPSPHQHRAYNTCYGEA